MDPTSARTLVAEHAFACSLCAREAGRIKLLAMGAAFELHRLSFTSKLTLPVPPASAERVRGAIAAADIRDLYDFDLEVACFYCPECDACFCGEHWEHWPVFDDEDGWYDYTHGRCPKGHERMLED